MKTKLCCFLVFVSLKLFAQVNLQTGTPQINFPLFSISDEANRLSTSVSLNYVGGNGIKVNSMAPNWGTGWNLDFGGFVMRVQNGEPDDQKQNTTFNLPTNFWEYDQYIDNYYPNGFLYSEFNAITPMTNVGAQSRVRNGAPNVIQNPLDPIAPKVATDREQDIFMFNFNGRQGKFIFGKNGQSSPILQLNENDSKLKISVAHDLNLLGQNIRTTIREFKITDEYGIEYYFEEMELSEVIKYIKREVWTDSQLNLSEILGSNTSYQGFCSLPVTPPSSGMAWSIPYQSPSQINNSRTLVLKGVRTGKYVCNRWMLTKIRNPFTNNSITFTYSNIEVVTETSHTVSKNSNENGTSLTVQIGLLSEKTKRISFIENGHNNERILFNYGVQRKDAPYDFVLDHIRLVKNNQDIVKYKFNCAYFYRQNIRPLNDNINASELPYLRLVLTSFQKIGLASNLVDKPTIFTYYIGDTDLHPSGDYVPPPFSIFHDHWGYYNFGGTHAWDMNTVNGENPIGLYELPKKCFPYMKQVYKQSVTPDHTNSGFFRGISNYTEYSLGARAGLIKSIQNSLGGSTNYTYEANYVRHAGQNKRMGGVRVKSVTFKDGLDPVNNQIKEFTYLKDDGLASSGFGYEEPVYSVTKPVKFYTCGFSNPSTGMIPKQYVAAGGAYLGMTIAHYGLSGAFALDPVSFVVAVGISLWNLFNPPPDPPEFYDLNATITSSVPLNYHNLLPFMYSRVEVRNIQNTHLIGRDVFTFTNPEIYPIEVPVLNTPYASKQRFLDFKYGLVSRHEIRNASNLLVKKIEYGYSTTQSTISDPIFGSQKWITNSELLNCESSLTYNDFGATDRIISDIYYPIVGKIDLVQTNEYNYNSSGNYTLTTTDFEYNADNQVNKKIQYNSKGERIETAYKYVNDYTSNGVIATMKTNNMGSLPVLTETYIYKNNNADKYLVGGSINEYAVLPNSDVKPKKTYQFFSGDISNPRPRLNSTVAAFNPLNIIRDPSYYKEVSNIEYNNFGQPVETNTHKGSESVVYSLSNPEQVIAKASNARRNNIAYTSFEEKVENTTITNNQEWNYNKYFIWNEDALSGNTSFKFTNSISTISKSNLNSSIEYRLTFWAKNTVNQNYVANNFQLFVCKTLSPSGQNIPVEKIYTNPVTGWSLYQCFVQSATAINIHNQNPSNTSQGNPMMIDEVRIYPKNAQMTSAAYNAMDLKITEVDASDKVMYYEFDALGRLKLVRDELRNVIKTYEYNYVN